MMAMEFCGREYNFPTHFGEVADTCGDLNIACPSCLLAHIAKLEAHIAQLEAQRGELARELDLTKREAWTAKERHKDEKDRADGLRERLDELNADEFVKAQRGGAVVVPAWNRSDFDKVPPEWSEMQCFGAGYELAASRIQPIPAGGALADGMVGVDRERLAALEAISDKIEALALGPDGRAWTPLHYREFARGELRRAQQAKGE